MPSFTRLQTIIGLTPGNLITHVRMLEEAGHISREKTGAGRTSRISVALNSRAQKALDTCTTAPCAVLVGL